MIHRATPTFKGDEYMYVAYRVTSVFAQTARLAVDTLPGRVARSTSQILRVVHARRMRYTQTDAATSHIALKPHAAHYKMTEIK